MGCYMSVPDDKVYITEGKGKNFTYATASCQGWRRDQEDAEACIPDFEDDASLFILCDGHGGPEVAKYTVDHLPNFLKNHPLYKEGKYAEALEKAFIDFDAQLRKPEIVAEVTKIAFDGEQEKEKAESKDDNDSMDVGTSGCPSVSTEAAGSSGAGGGASGDDAGAGPSASGSSSGISAGGSSGPSASSSRGAGPSTSNGASTVAEDVDAETLRREAQVPIDELIHKYADQSGAKGRMQSLRKANLNLNASPVIKSKDDQEADCKKENEESKEDDQEASSSTSNAGQQQQQAEPSSSKSAEEGPSSTSGGSSSKDEPKTALDIFKKAIEQYFDENDDDDSENDSEFEGSNETDSDEDDDDDDDDEDEDEDDDDEEEDEDEDEDGDDERDEEQQGEPKSKSKKLLRKKQRKLAAKRGDVSSSEEDSDDYGDSTSDDENNEDDDDEDDDDEDGDEFGGHVSIPQRVRASLKAASKIHKPVWDSGCTVVVALVKGNKLYVGSAGDSRCILIMRDGQCKPMSFDHKPEDPIEHRRIQKAGGQVIEGRVNGGLNLSRAMGDFTYKSGSLEAKDQMITPCPDVRTTELDPEQVEYIFLACDGIWNSMKNQQVTKFIRKIAPTVDNDLVQICTAVFKHCLAPGTDGDGTGCDNMTCILARYNSSSSSERDSSTTNQSDLNTLSTTNTSETTTTTTTTSTTTNEIKKSEKNEVESKLGGDIKGANKRNSDEESGNGPMNSKKRCLRLLED